MINLCFLSGEVKNKIDLKFIYNPKTKSLSKRHNAIVLLDLEIEKGQMVKAYAYDKVADWIYRNIQQDSSILVQGRITEKGIEIETIRFYIFASAMSARAGKDTYNIIPNEYILV